MSSASKPGQIGPLPNKNTPAIPQPQASIAGLVNTLTRVRDAIHSLTGRAGAPVDRAVTFQDLINLGLTTSAAVTSATGSITAPLPGITVSNGTDVFVGVTELVVEGVGITGYNGTSVRSGGATLTITG